MIKVLKDYVDKAQKGGSKYVFVTSDGIPFGYKDLQRYFREQFSGISPTDFRKLKATETVLSALGQEQKQLYVRIREFAQLKTGDLRERVVEEVVGAVERAYVRAQQALSHEDVATTVRAYVNPEVLLRFLSQGQVDKTLSDAVLTGKTKLTFDPEVFVARALKVSGLNRVATSLQDLLEGLEIDLALV